jgi:hypothetical protein
MAAVKVMPSCDSSTSSSGSISCFLIASNTAILDYEGYISPGSSPRGRQVDRAEFKIRKSSPVKLRVDEPRFNSFLQTIFSTSLFIDEYTRGIIENSISYGSS